MTVEVCVLEGWAGMEEAGTEAGGWKDHWRKWTSAPFAVEEEEDALESLLLLLLLLFSVKGTSVSRGKGRTNCGYCRAVEAMRLYVSNGIQAQMEYGFFTCRRRHNASISLGGREATLSTSRYELRGLIPVSLVEDFIEAAGLV